MDSMIIFFKKIQETSLPVGENEVLKDTLQLGETHEILKKNPTSF